MLDECSSRVALQIRAEFLIYYHSLWESKPNITDNRVLRLRFLCWYKLIRWAEDDMKFFMKNTTFLIIAFITLISVGCVQVSDWSANSDNSEIEGPVLTDIPSGKYELFSILNAVYEANPNAFDNQVKEKEFKDMLLATLNSRAKRRQFCCSF